MRKFFFKRFLVGSQNINFPLPISKNGIYHYFPKIEYIMIFWGIQYLEINFTLIKILILLIHKLQNCLCDVS